MGKFGVIKLPATSFQQPAKIRERSPPSRGQAGAGESVKLYIDNPLGINCSPSAGFRLRRDFDGTGQDFIVKCGGEGYNLREIGFLTCLRIIFDWQGERKK